MTLHALVAVDDTDRPLAVGGYYLKAGVAVAFSDHKTMTKRDIVAAGRALVGVLRGLGVAVVARADNPTALRHFGFAPHDSVWRLT